MPENTENTENTEYANDSTLLQRHLGDGVYARWDGYHVILDLRGQGEDWCEIALDADVIKSLNRFHQDCLSKMRRVA